jgi:large subunit ribosomal protein L10
MKIVMGTLTFETIKEYFKGPTAIIYGGKELNAGAKILANFSKVNEKLQIKAGMLSGSMITGAQVRELATLPSREVLLGKMCGVLNRPITGLAIGLNGIIKSLATALDAVAKKKEK